MATMLERACRYVVKMPAGVAGQNGHLATLFAAKQIVHFFGLHGEDGMAAMRAYNGICTPAWSDRELAHKVAQAEKSPWSGGKAEDERKSNPGKVAQSRTLRTGFLNYRPAAGAQTANTRTLRIGFLPYYAYAHTHTHITQGASAGNSSGPSEHETLKATSENLSEASEPIEQDGSQPCSGFRLTRTRATIPDPNLVTWVTASGAAYQARWNEADEVPTLEIGQQLSHSIDTTRKPV